MGPPIPGFEAFELTDGPITHTVYCSGEGRGVLLLHELPGMTAACIRWAEEIAASGFRVFMPLLFGAPNDDDGIGFFPQLCVSREFSIFASGGGSPVVTWLRALGRRALELCGGPGVAAIGMCLTGNFAVALMADEKVLAAVASQPALPITATIPVLGDITGSHEALGITDEELAAATARARAGVPLMCLRFSNDSISPVERFDRLRDVFGAAFHPFLLGSAEGIDSSPGNIYGLPQRAHSVLTGEYKAGDPNHPTRLARDAVLAFLHDRLDSD